MKVKEVLADPRMKPLSGVESFAQKRAAQRAHWIGVKATGLTEAPWFGLRTLRDRPPLPGIIYHTVRDGRHPSGNGIHDYFPELLIMPTAAASGEVYSREDIIVSALLG